ncbi:MAG: TonB-dependent receptor [Gammaproteobacteria bacterium]|nr:TonB-dependent receptor [Gammaproteobacteria bacterium]
MRIICLFVATLAAVVASAGEREYLETTIVTASRLPQSIAEVTSSVSVITRAEIERRHITFVSDLLRTVPGLAVSNSGGVGKFTQIRVRGAEANHVLVLIDGIEANDLSADDSFDFANLTSDNIERIEIVRGPHSSLWGSEAVAGVINIITRGGDEAFSADFVLEGGSFATNRISVSVGGTIENLSVRAAVNRTDTGGTNISREGDEDDAYHQQTVNIKSRLQLNDALRLDASVRHTSTDVQTDPSIDVVTGLPIDSAGVLDSNQSYAGAGLTLALWDGVWTQQLYGRWTSTKSSSFDPVFLNSSLSGDKYVFSYQSTWRFRTEGWWVDDHALVFALDHELEEFQQAGSDHKLDATGYVVEYASRWFDALAVSGSVRYDRNSDFRNVTTFRAAGAYDMPFNLGRLTLAYGTGQKAPTFFDRFGFSPGFGTFIGNPTLLPEKSEGWEVSFRQGFGPFDGLVDVSYFNERTEEEIDGFFFVGGGTFTAINRPGITRRRGVEVGVRARISDAFEATGSYTYVKATDVLDGPRLTKVRIPRHQGSIDASYFVFNGRGDVNLRVNIVGNQDDFDFSMFPSPRVPLGGHTSIGISAGYQVSRHIRFFARVDNLLDEDFEEVLGFAQPGIAGFAGVRITTNSE